MEIKSINDMKVVVESGASKSEWRIIGEGGKLLLKFVLPGMNVSADEMDSVRLLLLRGIERVRECVRREGDGVEGMYLYMAGLTSESLHNRLESFIRSAITLDEIEIQDDLTAAARALYGGGEGIVAIMGTGSNACFYDGQNIIRQVYSGGYILGDDGSGAVLGRMFLSDLIKGIVPPEVSEDFSKKYDASYGAIVDAVYHGVSPSAYLGSFAPFILSHIEVPYVREIVERNFQNFIDRSLLRYDVTRYPVGVTGGFGYACRDIFAPLCEKAGIRLSRFLPAPIDGLVEYYSLSDEK